MLQSIKNIKKRSIFLIILIIFSLRFIVSIVLNTLWDNISFVDLVFIAILDGVAFIIMCAIFSYLIWCFDNFRRKSKNKRRIK